MTEHELKHLIQLIPDEELRPGHVDRFRNRLYASVPLQQKLWTVQKLLIAASVTLMLTGALTLLIHRHNLSYQVPMLTNISPELQETERYYENQIQYKIQILSSIDHIDRNVIHDFKKEDKSIRNMRRDLRKNPGDIRLTCAVLETYQRRIDALDNMIARYR